MYCFSRNSVDKPSPHQDIIHNAVLIGNLACFLLFTACGSSTPGSSPATGTGTTIQPAPSGSSLTISSSLPSASVGSSYNGTIAVTGGTAPYTFAVASGALPQGLALGSSSGTVSGTPTTAGAFNFSVSVSDTTGQSKEQSLQITVSSAPVAAVASAGNSLSSLQHSGGWASYGQVGPNYVDCSPSPCDGITFSMTQGVDSPSLSGEATAFYVGGTAPFSDALFNNHLIGSGSSQGLPDTNQTLVPSLYDFTYDVYFYGSDFSVSQAIEFDINQFFNNLGLIFGHQCNVASGNEWYVWDNQNKSWTATGIPCYPNENSWNHLTLKVQRTSNNELEYQSITLNGTTNTLNWTFPAGSSPGWYGLTINYQMDGNANQDGYTVYLDNLTFTYQ
jgi:Putative Ig domain